MEHTQQVAEQLGNAFSKVQYTGSFIAVILGFMNEYAAALGVLIGIIGLLANIYFKRKALKLYIKRMSETRRGDIPDPLKAINEITND